MFFHQRIKFFAQFSFVGFQFFIEFSAEFSNKTFVDLVGPLNVDPDWMDEVHEDVAGRQDLVRPLDDDFCFRNQLILTLVAKQNLETLQQVKEICHGSQKSNESYFFVVFNISFDQLKLCIWIHFLQNDDHFFFFVFC